MGHGIRECKLCNKNIDEKNKNAIYCNVNCRNKWDYHNKEGVKQKRIKNILEKRNKKKNKENE